MSDNILVSISCLTFNHAKYLRKCLDGFLMQQCDFNFEILIHDDASTDGTIDIINEYQQKYPALIKPLIQTENQYSKGVRAMNIKFNYPRAKGKYIALCEGDDYWTDPLKLQKQVDFLEKNPSFSGVISNRTYYNFLNKQSYTTNYPRILKTKDILLGEVLPTQTIMFRNELNALDFDPFKGYPAGDRILSYIMSLKGPVYCLPESTAVYNYTGEGVWSKYKNQSQSLLNIRSLKQFHSIIGLENSSKYIPTISLILLLKDRSFGKISISDADLKKEFNFSNTQFLYAKIQCLLSNIKHKFFS